MSRNQNMKTMLLPHRVAQIGNMSELPRCERRRLALMEDGWKLLAEGTTLPRTRGGGLGRPMILERASLGHAEEDNEDTAEEEEDSEAKDDESLEDDEDSETAPAVTKGKPTHNRESLWRWHISKMHLQTTLVQVARSQSR
jgi:hypothetical protein